MQSPAMSILSQAGHRGWGNWGGNKEQAGLGICMEVMSIWDLFARNWGLEAGDQGISQCLVGKERGHL